MQNEQKKEPEILEKEILTQKSIEVSPIFSIATMCDSCKHKY